MRYRSVVPVLAPLAVLVALVASSCTRNESVGAADPPDSGVVDDAPECELIPAETVSSITSVAFRLDPELTGPSTCAFVDRDGTRTLTIESKEAATGDAVAALVANYGLAEAPLGVNDQIFVSGEPTDVAGSAPVHTVLVRFGGSVALIRLATPDAGEQVTVGLAELARDVVQRLPKLPFDSDVSVEAADCGRIDGSALAAALGLPTDSLTVSPVAGLGGCSIASSSSTITTTVAVEPGIASVESLGGRGGSVSEGGESFEITPQPVENVGSGAVWLFVPRNSGSGELFALISDRLVRVTVAGGEEDQMLTWASLVAGRAGAELVQ